MLASFGGFFVEFIMTAFWIGCFGHRVREGGDDGAEFGLPLAAGGRDVAWKKSHEWMS